MRHHYFSMILLVSLVLGCGRTEEAPASMEEALASIEDAPASIEYAPVSINRAKAVKTGTPLAEVKKFLGEPHPPTSTQAKHLAKYVSRLREPLQSYARQDESLAWGNDTDFLAVKVNDKGIVWVTAWQQGPSGR